jgi:hypothetical protein
LGDAFVYKQGIRGKSMFKYQGQQTEYGSFMIFMKASQINAPGGDFVLVQKEIPQPKEHEILLKKEACGICYSDAIVKYGDFADFQYPVFLREHVSIGFEHIMITKVHFEKF